MSGMNEGFVPRLAVAVALGDLPGVEQAVRTAVASGVDSVLLDAGAAGPDEAIAGVAAIAGWVDVPVVLAGSPSAASAAGAGALLPESGMSSGEARRMLGPGLPLGREVGAPEVAAVAHGLDFLVVSLDGLGAPDVRAAVESSWFPVLARVGDADGAASAIRAGCEGVIVPVLPGLAISDIAAALPPRHEAEQTVTLNGDVVPLEPDTSVADLLADAGLSGMGRVTVNGVAIPRRGWDDRLIEAGDRIESQ